MTLSNRGPATNPGEMRFARTPCLPRSKAKVRIIPTMPSLDAAYTLRFMSGRFPVIDPMKIMEPDFREIMEGMTAFESRKGPLRFVSIVSSHSASFNSQSGAALPAMPLLFTKISIWPKVSKDCVTEFSMVARSSRSIVQTSGVGATFNEAISSAVPFKAGISLPARISCAPSPARARLIARPIPLPAPVTSATLFSNSFTFILASR